jgi:CBS domain-containing protein
VLIDRIATLPLTPPVTVESGTNVGTLLEEVQRRKVGCVLVSEAGRTVGIITERDVLLKIVARNVPETAAIDDYMTRNPETLTLEHSIGDAVNMMIERNFRHIPVVDADGNAKGIVSVKDVINLIAESFPEKVLNLPPRPHQKMESPDGG